MKTVYLQAESIDQIKEDLDRLGHRQEQRRYNGETNWVSDGNKVQVVLIGAICNARDEEGNCTDLIDRVHANLLLDNSVDDSVLQHKLTELPESPIQTFKLDGDED